MMVFSGKWSGFNPRSREGSDAGRRDQPHPGNSFNPRSREGSDGGFLVQIKRQNCFNPRSREGSDAARDTLIIQLSMFQSTLPRRERLWIKGNGLE